MTNTYDEYADKAAASYLQGRMDEQGVWVEAVKEMLAYSDTAIEHRMREGGSVRYHAGRAAALDALLRRMGAE